jgi:chaperonin GroEL (HSP60 family)
MNAATGGTWYGVDVFREDIADNFIATVWEPSLVKINALTAAAEAAALILSVDETVKNPTSSIVCVDECSFISMASLIQIIHCCDE